MTRPMPGPPEDCYCRDGNATCDECEANGYPYSWGLCPGCHLHNGYRGSRETRFTDAECAAEYWRAEADSLRSHPDVESWSARPVDSIARGHVWHRFATHPHALEARP